MQRMFLIIFSVASIFSVIAMDVKPDREEGPQALLMTEIATNSFEAARHGKYSVACCLCATLPCFCLCDTGFALHERMKPLVKTTSYVAYHLGIVEAKKIQ